MKRNIEIKRVKGITKSSSVQYGEFTIHMINEYDFRMKSKSSRDEIIDILKKVYIYLNHLNLPIYGVVKSFNIYKYINLSLETKITSGIHHY